MTAAIDPRLTDLIDQAFEYRGFVTLSKRDGSQVVGFLYDRTPDHVDLFDEKAVRRIRVATADLADVQLTGEDAAAKAQRIWERRQGALEPRETSVYGEWGSEAPVLVLVAMPMELRTVGRVLGGTPRGAVVRGRHGDSRAVGMAIGVGGSAGAAQAIAAEKPRLVLSCGFAGALDASLQTGDLVLASSVRDEQAEPIAADRTILRAARRALSAAGERPVVEGELLCATEVAVTSDEKSALARPGRAAIDLESGPIARAAERAGVPWLALRVILDPLELDLPPFTRTAHADYLAPALRFALGGPRAVGELARLGLRARTAGKALERALRRLGPVIGSLARPEPTA